MAIEEASRNSVILLIQILIGTTVHQKYVCTDMDCQEIFYFAKTTNSFILNFLYIRTHKMIFSCRKKITIFLRLIIKLTKDDSNIGTMVQQKMTGRVTVRSTKSHGGWRSD